MLKSDQNLDFKRFFIVNPHIKRHVMEKHYTNIVTTLLVQQLVHCCQIRIENKVTFWINVKQSIMDKIQV